MKALVVDDDLITRIVLQEILSGYAEVHSCVDGSEAVLAYRRALERDDPYDLVCMDVLMPVMGGIGRQRVMSTIPGSVPWVLFTMLGAAVTVPLSYFPMTAGLDSGPLPAQVETRIATVGYDQKQRRLPFTVYVLTQQLSWKLES